MDKKPTDNNLSSSDSTTRRTFLAGTTASATAMLAGCTSDDGGDDDGGLLGDSGAISGESGGESLHFAFPPRETDSGRYFEDDLSGVSDLSIEQLYTPSGGWVLSSWEGYVVDGDVVLIWSDDVLQRVDKDGLVWENEIVPSSGGGPFVIDGSMYLRTNGQVYVFDVESGDRTNLYSDDEYPSTNYDILYEDGSLYGLEVVADDLNDGEERLIQYDIAANERTWEQVVSVNENSQSSTILDYDDGLLYTYQHRAITGGPTIGIYDIEAEEFITQTELSNFGTNREYRRGDYFVGREDDTMVVISFEDEEILWKEDNYEMDVNRETYFAVDNNRIYRRIDGGIGGYDITTGEQLWTTQIPGGRLEQTVTTGTELIVTSGTDELFIFNAETGEQIAHTDDETIGGARHLIVANGSIWGGAHADAGRSLVEITV